MSNRLRLNMKLKDITHKIRYISLINILPVYKRSKVNLESAFFFTGKQSVEFETEVVRQIQYVGINKLHLLISYNSNQSFVLTTKNGNDTAICHLFPRRCNINKRHVNDF